MSRRRMLVTKSLSAEGSTIPRVESLGNISILTSGRSELLSCDDCTGITCGCSGHSCNHTG